MPTGYTAAIQDGISFKEFTLRCARAFGALIELRDEPLDKALPEKFTPSSYHADALRAAKEEMTRLEGISPVDAEKFAARDYEKAEQSRRASLEKMRGEKIKYETMLSQVQAWTPPTPDHAGLKRFMVEQIEGSIKFDCGHEHYYETPKLQQTGTEWLAAEKARVGRDIAYHTEHDTKESSKVAERNEWLDMLRRSL